MLLNHKLIGFDVPAKLFTPEKIVAAFGGAARPVQTSAGPMLINDGCCGGHDASV
jgi:hypothetical protein